MQFRNSLILCSLLATLAVSRVCVASDTSEPGQPVQAASRLQVSGNRQQFSIEADHADVQSALKAVFVQADKQFDMDNNVAGQVTLKLTSQTFDTTLSSLCKQTFLKYRVDAGTGIYHFEQDADAVAASFKRINTLNAELKQQLRSFGLDLSDDMKLEAALGVTNGGRNATNPTNLQADSAGNVAAKGRADGLIANGQGGFGGGQAGPGGGGLSTQNQAPAGSLGSVGERRSGGAGRSIGPAGPVGNLQEKNAAPAGAAGKANTDALQTPPGYKDVAINPDFISTDQLVKLLEANGLTSFQVPPQTLDRAYGYYLKQNSLLTINTNGVAIPVSDVLAELSRQSGVPIMLDPSVPRGPKFRINLSLPPCSLNEALNLVLPPAKLRWRMINNRVYVTPNPDFQIFYGSAPTPYVIFGNGYSNSNQSQRGQQNGGPQGQNGGQNGGQGGKQP